MPVFLRNYMTLMYLTSVVKLNLNFLFLSQDIIMKGVCIVQ